LQPSHAVVAFLEIFPRFAGKVACAPAGENIETDCEHEARDKDNEPRTAQQPFPAAASAPPWCGFRHVGQIKYPLWPRGAKKAFLA
jgi:hypothetical protein